jgi:hypothetical protein
LQAAPGGTVPETTATARQQCGLMSDVSAGRAPGRFVILALPRTGSNYLTTRLNQHPNIIANGRILNLKNSDWGGAVRQDMTSDELLRLGHLDFPNPRQRTDVRAVGFKVHDSDGRTSSGRADLLGLLSTDPTVSVVHLTRDNLLESLRSRTQVERTRRWVARCAADLEDMPTVCLTPQMCHAYFHRAKRFTARVQELFARHRVLPLTYEELCADPMVQFRRVQEFLGVSVQDLAASFLMKQESRPLSEVVENFIELREEFRGTQYWRFFE